MFESLLYGGAYALVGIAMLAAGFLMIDLLTPGHLGHKVYTDRSVNAAVVVSAAFLGLGAIEFTAIWTNAASGFGAVGVDRRVRAARGGAAGAQLPAARPAHAGVLAGAGGRQPDPPRRVRGGRLDARGQRDRLCRDRLTGPSHARIEASQASTPSRAPQPFLRPGVADPSWGSLDPTCCPMAQRPPLGTRPGAA